MNRGTFEAVEVTRAEQVKAIQQLIRVQKQRPLDPDVLYEAVATVAQGHGGLWEAVLKDALEQNKAASRMVDRLQEAENATQLALAQGDELREASEILKTALDRAKGVGALWAGGLVGGFCIYMFHMFTAH